MRQSLNMQTDDMPRDNKQLTTRFNETKDTQEASAAAFDRTKARRAADDLLRASKGLTLGGLSIKELAREGR